MLLTASLVLLGLLVLSFANGANDISKGISTLVGARLATARQAILWGSAWTLVGSLLSVLVARGLIQTFNGAGIIEGGTSMSGGFIASVAAGALGWLLIATRLGLPVSTTHSIVGALVGAAITAAGIGGVRWDAVTTKIALPLILSPALAAFVGAMGRGVARRISPDDTARCCVCIERITPHPQFAHDAMAGKLVAPFPSFMESSTSVIVGIDCPSPVVARLTLRDGVHWFASGMTCLARAVNDTPKLAALGIGGALAFSASTTVTVAVVAAAMVLGGIANGLRVTDTMARKMTTLTPDTGVTAMLATSLLVASASFFSLPVSTTHVATGATLGSGYSDGSRIQWRTVREIALAWVITLPASAVLAAIAVSLSRSLT